MLPLNPPKMSTQRRHSSRSSFNELFPDWLIVRVTQYHAVKWLVEKTVDPKEAELML